MRLGMPQPRFTYAPSGNSMAARCAICSRVSRGLSGIADSFRLHDAMHENRGRDDMLGLDGADRNDFVYLDDGGCRSHSHNGIEIPRGEAVREIAQFVGGLGLDESIVRVDGHFEDAALPFDDAFFFAGSDFRTYANSRIKPAKARGCGAHALTKNSLGNEFERHFFGGKLLLKISGVRTGKRCDHMTNLAVLEHQSQLAIVRSAVVADGRDIFRALL